jgi:hypothetical protein
MSSVCAEIWADGAWRMVCYKGEDSEEGRAWLLGEVRKEFGANVPVSFKYLNDEGLYVPLAGFCRGGCNCTSGSCPGRAKGPRSTPAQPGARTRPGRKPRKPGTPVHAEDVDMPDGDLDEQESGFPEPQWHAGDGNRKPRRDDREPERPPDTEAEAHAHLLALVSALIGHVHRTRGREGRKELADAVGTLPCTMAGQQLRQEAEHCLAVTAPRRASPARRRFFAELHGAR